MVSRFGRFLRKLRIDNNLILKDMADILDVSSSMLSAVENGKKSVPLEWEQIIIDNYNLNESEKEELHYSIVESIKQVRIDLELYKTPHERLLELGWIIDKDDTNPTILEFYYKKNKVLIIDKALKAINTLYAIDLELAEVLVDYLKELENEQKIKEIKRQNKEDNLARLD